MPAKKNNRSGDAPAEKSIIPDGFAHYRARIADAQQREMATAIEAVVAAAPLYRPSMPRTGKLFSIVMTNCGPLGWVSDKEGGYRYQPNHPFTGSPWPAIPQMLMDLWSEVADYPAPPQACLVNHYTTGTRLGSHVDADEQDFTAPVVSVSLGDDAIFHLGGTTRLEPKQRILLQSGDVVVLGGTSRRAYHGIDRIIPGTSDVIARGGRFNLTLRRITRPGD